MGKKQFHTHLTHLIAPFLLGAILSLLPARARVGEQPILAGALGEGRVAKGAVVDQTEVGGMTIKEAEQLLRRQAEGKTPSLIIEGAGKEYVFSYPQIGFFDDASSVLANAKKNGVYETKRQWFLKGEEEQLDFICDNIEKRAFNAEAKFSSSGFVYERECAGISCDRAKLKEDVESALSAGAREENGKTTFPAVKVVFSPIVPKITERSVRKDTVKISSFITCFNENDGGRVANIALAAARIDGMTVRPNEEFSFNGAVGARTKENGFFEAKIISDGEFVAGTGGGVCQVSTTLYNAALKAGLKITARKPHSLAVSYVEPSRDAMVSSYSDFRFKNDKPFPVYLSVKVKGNVLTACVFGRDEGYRYEIIGKIIGEIPPPEPMIKDTKEGVIREGRAGIKSEAYLETYRYGKLIKREKLHEDAYAPVRGIVGKTSAPVLGDD
jgi:vancomycin resistance protein YoaR